MQTNYYIHDRAYDFTVILRLIPKIIHVLKKQNIKKITWLWIIFYTIWIDFFYTFFFVKSPEFSEMPTGDQF